MKKIIITGIIALAFGIGYYPVFWLSSYGVNDEYSGFSFPYNDNTDTLDLNECDNQLWHCTDLWNQVDIRNNGNNLSIINRLLSVFGLDSDTLSWDHKFLNYAKAILNIALWLLSLIALIMTIYTFYMMFFTDNETWIKKAKWNLVGIFIALAIIGLAWLIVSFIFRWYQNNWQNALI